MENAHIFKATIQKVNTVHNRISFLLFSQKEMVGEGGSIQPHPHQNYEFLTPHQNLG